MSITSAFDRHMPGGLVWAIRLPLLIWDVKTLGNEFGCYATLLSTIKISNRDLAHHSLTSMTWPSKSFITHNFITTTADSRPCGHSLSRQHLNTSLLSAWDASLPPSVSLRQFLHTVKFINKNVCKWGSSKSKVMCPFPLSCPQGTHLLYTCNCLHLAHLVFFDDSYQDLHHLYPACHLTLWLVPN